MRIYFVQDESGYGAMGQVVANTPEEAVRIFIDDEGLHDEYGLHVTAWETKVNPKTFSIVQPTELILKPVIGEQG